MLVIPITFNLDKQQSAYPLTEIIASHDIQSIKFELSFNGIDLTGKTVKVLSKYESSGSQTLLDCLIVEGKAILIPDTSLISGEGYVHNYVYVYEGASSLDVQEFLYETKLSEIDRSSVVIKKVYDKSYNNLLLDFEQALNDYKLTIPELSAEIDVVLNRFGVESQAKLNQYDTVANALLETVEYNELTRVSSESTRKTNETTRISNENARKSAEVIRLVSEVDRVNAENVRAEFYEGFESELGNKANKQQEDWITPTLLNGWIGNIKYRKNEDGMVVVTFNSVIVPATSTYNQSIFMFPEGYRSGFSTSMFLIDNTGSGKPTESLKISTYCIVASLRVGASISGTVTFVGV